MSIHSLACCDKYRYAVIYLLPCMLCEIRMYILQHVVRNQLIQYGFLTTCKRIHRFRKYFAVLPIFAAKATVCLSGCFEKFPELIEKMFFMSKNDMKRTFRGKFIGGGGQTGAKE